MFGEFLENVKIKKPIIHNITNFVTANDCANILLAAGASPIMANEYKEMADITRLSHGLNINLGTINDSLVPSMLLAGKLSNDLSHPVVLDLVGVGASSYRFDVCKRLIEQIKFSVVKGNISEIKTLILEKNFSNGVDAVSLDQVSENSILNSLETIKSYAKKVQCTLVVTGPVDLVTNGDQSILIENGHTIMADITGSGCMLSALISAFISSNKDKIFKATAAAVSAFGLAGEIAYTRLNDLDGSGSFRTYLIDGIYNMRPDDLNKNSKCKII